MGEIRQQIKQQLCYTELVYPRINRKLKTTLSKRDIENLVFDIVSNERNSIDKIGKNYYINDRQKQLQVTINSSTYRVITMDTIN